MWNPNVYLIGPFIRRPSVPQPWAAWLTVLSNKPSVLHYSEFKLLPSLYIMVTVIDNRGATRQMNAQMDRQRSAWRDGRTECRRTDEQTNGWTKEGVKERAKRHADGQMNNVHTGQRNRWQAATLRRSSLLAFRLCWLALARYASLTLDCFVLVKRKMSALW